MSSITFLNVLSQRAQHCDMMCQDGNLVPILADLLPIQLPGDVPRKATAKDQGTWASATQAEDPGGVLALGLSPSSGCSFPSGTPRK